MAVISSMPSSPPKPTGLKVKVRPDKSFEIRWKAEGGASLFELTISYFPFQGPMFQPSHSNVQQVEGFQTHLPHPDELSRAQAWVVKISLKAKSDGSLSDAVEYQIAWDDELFDQEARTDLENKVEGFQTNDLHDFVSSRRDDPKILVLGPQHHGKSSFVNHAYRCLIGNLDANDQLDQAPAGADERTLATKSIDIPVGQDSQVTLIDTPAFATMSQETEAKLRTLLSSGHCDGLRRQDMRQNKCSWYSRPPHAAIVVMSLCHWRDQRQEMASYLQKIAGVLKTASAGTVEFPYVVAATHCDEFLENCQKEDPRDELEKALQGIKGSASTNHVYAITNYMRGSMGSARNNKATFDLLSQLLAKAKRENTATNQDHFRSCMAGGAIGTAWTAGMVVNPPVALTLTLMTTATTVLGWVGQWIFRKVFTQGRELEGQNDGRK
ncbi:Uncharacterized protein SCF082_LOCUS23990 [Durusdinium trenchii]